MPSPDRCPRCDRAECPTLTTPNDHGTDIGPEAPSSVEPAPHSVAWLVDAWSRAEADRYLAGVTGASAEECEAVVKAASEAGRVMYEAIAALEAEADSLRARLASPPALTVGAIFADDFEVIEYDAAPYIVRWRQMGWTDRGFAARVWEDAIGGGWSPWHLQPASLLKVDAGYPARRVTLAEADRDPATRGPLSDGVSEAARGGSGVSDIGASDYNTSPPSLALRARAEALLAVAGLDLPELSWSPFEASERVLGEHGGHESSDEGHAMRAATGSDGAWQVELSGLASAEPSARAQVEAIHAALRDAPALIRDLLAALAGKDGAA